MNEQTVTLTQGVFAAIVIIAVFVVMVTTIRFHAKKRPFSERTISLFKWLIKVLVCLFIVSMSGPGLRAIGNFLKW